MKRLLVLLLLATITTSLFAQKVDSIYFHLYTDSLKKGQHNYINVDAKLSNGRWLPLTAKDIDFSCAEARFEGTELVIPENFTIEKVKIKAALKKNPAIWIERVIWIKQKPDPELPGRQDLMNDSPSTKRNKRRKN